MCAAEDENYNNNKMIQGYTTHKSFSLGLGSHNIVCKADTLFGHILRYSYCYSSSDKIFNTRRRWLGRF